MEKINYFDELYFYNHLSDALSDEDLYQCFIDMKKGDNSARKKIIEHNLKFVIYEVNLKFSNCPCDVDDLISNGIIGLIKAVDTFDVTKNYKFLTYASRCIDNQIRMSFRNVKKHSGLISLDCNSYDDGDINKSIIEKVCVDNNEFENLFSKEEYEIVDKIVDTLDLRERDIIKMYFGFDGKKYNQIEIADKFNLSQSYLSRIINKILNKITMLLIDEQIVEKRYIKRRY